MINNHLGLVPLESLDNRVLQAWRDRRLKDISGGTFRREYSKLRTMYHWFSEERGALPPWPAIRLPSENPPKEARITREQQRNIERRLEGQPLAAFELGMVTGMRLGEILSIRRSNITLHDDGTGYLVLDKTKTGEHQQVPLGRSALCIIKSIPTTGDRVFTVSRSWVQKRLKDACGRLGYRDISFHTTRHECLSRLAERGLDLAALKRVSRHRNTAMLLRYARPSLESVARLMT